MITAARMRKLALRLVHGLGTLVAGFAVLAGLIAWRLSSGPVTVTALTPYLAEALDQAAGQAAGGLHTTVGDTVLNWGGFEHPLELRVRDVQLTTGDGQIVAAVPELAVGVSLRALARGRLALARVTAVRPTVHLERTRDGRLVLDVDGPLGHAAPTPLPLPLPLGPPVAGMAEGGAVTAGPALVAGLLGLLRQPPDPLSPLGALALVSVADASVTVEDLVSGRTWSVPHAELAASRDPDGVRAQARIESAPAGRPLVLEALARVSDRDPPPGKPVASAVVTIKDGTRLAARLDAVVIPGAAGTTAIVKLAELRPALLAGLVPGLEALAGVALPLTGSLTIEVDDTDAPARAVLVLTGGPGRIEAPTLLPDPVPVRSLAVRAAAMGPFAPLPARIDLTSVAVDFGGPKLELKGTVATQGERLMLHGGLTIAAIPVERLPKLWPPQVGKNAREWIVANITAGMVDKGWATFDGSAPLADPAAIVPTKMDAAVDASKLTVNYFKTLPPIVGINGHGTSDGHGFYLTTHGGHILDLAVGSAKLDFTKLDTPQEWLEIDAPLTGSLRSTLMVLDTPPLRYAHRVDIDPARTEGTQECRLHFVFPLRKDLDLDAVKIAAVATLHGAAAEGIGPGLAVAQGNLKLVLDTNGMDVTGTTRLENIPATVAWRENFGDNVELRTKVVLGGAVGEAELVRRGLHLAPYVGGPIATKAVLTVDSHHRTALSADLDLAQTRLAVPELDWAKLPGVAGRGHFTMEFSGGKPTRLPELTVEAADLKATGSARLDAASGRLERVSLSAVDLGASTVAVDVQVRPAKAGYDVTVRGPILDARPLFRSPANPQERRARRAERLARRSQPRVATPPYELTLAVNRLLTADGDRALTNVQGRLRHNGVGWDTADLTARLGGGPAALAVHLVPEGGKRRLSLTSDDAGAVLDAFDVTSSIKGGRLVLTGVGAPGIPVHPVSGHLELGAFRLVQAPLVARVLNALSVTGLMELLQSEGVTLAQASGDLTWGEDLITLEDVRTAGGALGLTIGGRLDLAADSLAIQGTIVPIYGLNRILGMVPVLGDWLSGGEGQGVFAATYHLSGPIDQPKVTVNPLAVLAPGALRNLFFLK